MPIFTLNKSLQKNPDNHQQMKSTSSYTHVYSEGEIIFQQGDLGTSAFIIEKGRVEISSTQNGNKTVLAKFDAGDLFGEMSLIDETTRAATAIALEPTEVIAVYRSIFDIALDSAHPVVNLMIHTIMGQRRQANPAWLSRVESDSDYASKKKNERKYQHAHAEIVNLVMAESELSEAIDESQFELYYQPIISLATDEIIGIEALIRWNHPEGGLITPDEFIPIAEKTCLMKKLGQFIIDSACQQLSKLTQELPDVYTDSPDFFVSINLSAQQFIYSDLIDQVKNSLELHKVSPKHIMFEITENILMIEPETAQMVLDDFKQQGFRIAIDDYGKGVSSMSYLHSFPIDTIKIDRSFIESMHTNSTSMIVVQAIIGLAKAIGLKIVAEGVETEEQFNGAKKLGCDLAQGYYMHRPMPFAELIDLLKNKL